MNRFALFLIHVFLAIPVITEAQQINFKISGQITKVRPKEKAYLFYRHTGAFSEDSAVIRNGHFVFSGSVSDIRKAYLRIGQGTESMPSQPIIIYLENTPMVVKNPGSFDQAFVAGGQLNRDNFTLQKMLRSVNDRFVALNRATRKGPAGQSEKEFTAWVTSVKDSLEQEQKSINARFIRQHPESLISLYAINEMINSVGEFSEIAPLFESLSLSIRQGREGKSTGLIIETMKKSIVGAQAPDFTQTDTLGNPVALHDFRGKYVLIDFWASWCAPCRAENPNVINAYSKFKNKGLEILGVSLDQPDGKTNWIKAIRDDHVTWMQVSDLKGWSNEAAGLYAVNAIPQNFLIDPSGKIVARNLRGEALEKRLSEIFAASEM